MRTVEDRLDAHAASDEIGGELEIDDVGIGDRLEPDGLPDARRPVVPDGVRRGQPVLLAARLGDIEGLIFGTHHDHLLAVCGEAGSDIGTERGMATFVGGDEIAVDPHRGAVVDGAEMQQQATARGGGAESAAIPEHGMKAGVANAGHFGLGRERHGDGAIEAGGIILPAGKEALVGIVIGELPGAVQIDPFGALDARARVEARLSHLVHVSGKQGGGCRRHLAGSTTDDKASMGRRRRRPIGANGISDRRIRPCGSGPACSRWRGRGRDDSSRCRHPSSGRGHRAGSHRSRALRGARCPRPGRSCHRR